MPKAYISEYSRLCQVGNGVPQIADESSLQAEYVVDFSGGPANGPAFQPATMYVRMNFDSTASFKIAVGAVATASNKRREAGTEYFGLGSLTGQGARFAAITNT